MWGRLIIIKMPGLGFLVSLKAGGKIGSHINILDDKAENRLI